MFSTSYPLSFWQLGHFVLQVVPNRPLYHFAAGPTCFQQIPRDRSKVAEGLKPCLGFWPESEGITLTLARSYCLRTNTLLPGGHTWSMPALPITIQSDKSEK